MSNAVSDGAFRCEVRADGEYVIRHRDHEIPVRSMYVQTLFARIGGPKTGQSVVLTPGRACTLFHEELGRVGRDEASSRRLAKKIIYSHRIGFAGESSEILDSLALVDRELLRLRKHKVLLIAGSFAADEAASRSVARPAKVA